LKIGNPADLYQKGDEVEAIILSINHDEKKVSLGVKQLWDDPWPTLMDKYKPGVVVEAAEILSVADYGAFVRLEEGVEGIIPNNDIPASATLSRGDKVKAEVSNVDSMDRRLTLSMRNPGESTVAEHVQVLKRESAGKGATLGDLLKDKLGAIKTTPASVPPPPPAADDTES
jgi:small subunit ribosomal protein S1